MPAIRDIFGFLPVDWTINFDGGHIAPVENYYEAVENIKSRLTESGFVYPINSSYSNLFKLPSSHYIFFDKKPNEKQTELRLGLGGFIIHLLAFFFDTTLQFHDWWFTRKVKIEKDLPTRGKTILASSGIAIFTQETLEDFLSVCIQKWNSFDVKKQRTFINLLYMHNYVESYTWDWERFAIQYMVLDACWDVVKGELKLRGYIPHSKRLITLCNHYNLVSDEEEIVKIGQLRNNLFHEITWDNVNPDSGGSTEAFYSALNLRKIVHRLVPTILNYDNAFVHSDWHSLGRYIFEKRKA